MSKGEMSPLAEMRANKRPVKVVDFPGDPDQKVGILLPSDYDMQQARMGAYRALVIDQKVDITAREGEVSRGMAMFTEETFARCLASCLVTADSAEGSVTRLCTDVEDMRKHLTAAQTQGLIVEMSSFTNEMDPNVDTPSGAEKAVQLLEVLEKKAGSRAALLDTLKGIEPSVLKLCLISSVEQRSTSADPSS